MITGLIAVGVVLLAGLGAGYMIFRAWRAQHVDWRPLPGHPGTVYFCEGIQIPTRIAVALHIAEICLVQNTKFTNLNFSNVILPRTQIYVKAVVSWPNAAGVMVRGEQANDTLIVGSDLATLPHELAHFADKVFGGNENLGHAGWAEKGFEASDQQFKLWLDANPSV